MITTKEKEAEFEKIKESITMMKKLKNFGINNIEGLFPTFASEYPTLTKAILKNYDEKILNMMLDSIENVIVGKKQFEETRYEVDKYLSDIYLSDFKKK